MLSPALKLIAALLLCVASVHGQDQVSIQSSALAKLAAGIEQGDRSSIEEFWKSRAAQRTPLIEEIPDHPNDALYTFLWRADATDASFDVRFTSSFTQRSRGGIERLKNLPKSDVWYGSYVLPKRAAIGYAFIVPTDSNPKAAVSGTLEREGVIYGLYRDPLNSKTVKAIGAEISYVEGPTAKSSLFLEESSAVAKGHIESVEIETPSVGGRRRVDVYTPAGYNTTSSPYPFILIFDGDEYTNSIPTPVILDNMIAEKAIPPVVVGFLHSPNRDRDLLPNEAFQRFLASELLPYIRGNYRVSTDARKNVVAGFSLSGLAAVYAAHQNPKLFGNVISQSGSLWWSPDFWDAPDFAPGQYLNTNSGALIKSFAERPKLPIRFYLEAGEWEDAGALLPNRLLASVLKGKGYDLIYREFLGGHDSFSWKQTLPDALIFALKSGR